MESHKLFVYESLSPHTTQYFEVISSQKLPSYKLRQCSWFLSRKNCLVARHLHFWGWISFDYDVRWVVIQTKHMHSLLFHPTKLYFPHCIGLQNCCSLFVGGGILFWNGGHQEDSTFQSMAETTSYIDPRNPTLLMGKWMAGEHSPFSLLGGFRGVRVACRIVMCIVVKSELCIRNLFNDCYLAKNIMWHKEQETHKIAFPSLLLCALTLAH